MLYKIILKYLLTNKFFKHIISNIDAEWSSLVARRAHNPKVGGSNPPSATNFIDHNSLLLWSFFIYIEFIEIYRLIW